MTPDLNAVQGVGDAGNGPLQRELVVGNRLGLHARATARLVQLLSGFDCHVTLKARGREVNAKSIMGVMLLAAGQGTTVVATAHGSDAAEALDAIADLFARGFDEAR